jgi:hypothetical protein
MRYIYLALFILGGFVLNSCKQTPSEKQLDSFFTKQDSLFVKAYQQRNVVKYDQLLAEFLLKYQTLSPVAQKRYSNQLTTAWYNFCCTYSLQNNRTKALDCLKKSITAGYFDYTHLQRDKDLDNIRHEPEFINLISPLKKVGDFRYILKKGATYHSNDQRILPDFTYQSSEDPNLKELRRSFNLDSVAGKGDEISRIKNMLHWVHNRIPHDGNHDNPIVKNAVSMIAECTRDNRGLNCRGLATVLNECYLAMGFKSRFVTCLPKDSLKLDNDCHVINVVYSDSLKKWLWIDPTNEAYVMNGNGELLSIEEVRERIINDLPLVVNADANWNHKSQIVITDYLYRYMAKNLYILECPVNSEYNSETNAPGKIVSYIQLLPLDYFNQVPDKKEGNGMIVYKTNNSKLFWQVRGQQ